MNPADKSMIFFGLLDLFYDYPLDFGPIINHQFFFLYMGYFDSVNGVGKQCTGQLMIQAFCMFRGSFQTLTDCNFVTLFENLLFFNDLNQEVRIMAVILGSDTLYRFFTVPY